jgi:hypothetical protein
LSKSLFSFFKLFLFEPLLLFLALLGFAVSVTICEVSGGGSNRRLPAAALVVPTLLLTKTWLDGDEDRLGLAADDAVDRSDTVTRAQQTATHSFTRFTPILTFRVLVFSFYLTNKI